MFRRAHRQSACATKFLLKPTFPATSETVTEKVLFVIPSEARDLLFFSTFKKQQIPRANPALRNDKLRPFPHPTEAVPYKDTAVAARGLKPALLPPLWPRDVNHSGEIASASASSAAPVGSLSPPFLPCGGLMRMGRMSATVMVPAMK